MEVQMARKRMFDNEIISQDDFLDLPKEAIALYFLLGMNADDEGFIAPKKILRLYNISEDNLKVLIIKGFVIPFESGVVVITDWKSNNYLDKNKIAPTIYQAEKKQLWYNEETKKYQWLNQSLTKVEQKLTQYSIEEYSIEKNSIDDDVNNINNNIIKSYEENIGMITPATAELLFSYLDDFTGDVIIKAINIASINNKRSGKYIAGILNDWNRKGLKTLLDIENAENNYNKKTTQETDEEKLAREIKEMEERFKNAD
jgi:DnaD/phage-associated family protein